jgi:lipopolysaccharide transport system ATP-binding protein
VRVLDKDGKVANSIEIQEPVSIEVEYRNLQNSLKPAALLHFFNENGDRLFTTCEFNNPAWRQKTVSPGLTRATCSIPGNFFAENVIYVQVSITSYAPDREHLHVKNAVYFQVVDRTQGEGVRGIAEGKWPGLLRPMLEWKIER